jgi:hypothetical protein
MAGLTFGMIGLFIFRYGKKQGHPPHMILGGVLMFYTYFFSNPWLTWGVGSGLVYLSYVLR